METCVVVRLANEASLQNRYACVCEILHSPFSLGSHSKRDNIEILPATHLHPKCYVTYPIRELNGFRLS